MTVPMSRISEEAYQRLMKAAAMEEGSGEGPSSGTTSTTTSTKEPQSMHAGGAGDDDDDGAIEEDEEEEEDIARLTTEGDGSDHYDSNDMRDQIYCNIQEIIPGLFIGDYTAAMDAKLLKEKDIKFIVAAMRQRYPVPEGIRIHRILIDDTSKTNIIRYFTESNALIRQARSEGKNVLVHCQAGVSRSTTLCAAFLMEEFDLTADEAVEKIASVRSVVCPAEFFMHQLELYERCNCECDPRKYPEYRRFLMNYNAEEMMDGDGVDELILAYYPSPAPSPRRSPGLPDPFLSMTPMSGSGATTPGPRSRRGSSTSISSQEARSEILARVRRGSLGGGSALAQGLGMTSLHRRMSDGQSISGLTMTSTNSGGDTGGSSTLVRRKSSRTKSTGERSEEIKKLRALLEEKRKAEAEKLAANPESTDAGSAKSVVPSRSIGTTTRKLRCKLCRRELAAREHILEHEPGQGQKAFAPRRRDMTQHRLDTEKRRQEKAKEAEARRLERQRVAAEAAEDLLQVAEEAVASDSEDEEMTDSSKPPGTVISGRSVSAAAESQSDTSAGGSSRLAQKAASTGQTARSLSARLPPQLAALRVSMPQRPMAAFAHDVSNAQSGSAIADDDAPTPGSEEPPSPPLLPSTICTSYFVEPLSWMQPQLENGDITGKIVCPNTKCGAKLGNFDWSGLRCSCAAWVCPGFSLQSSRVDEVKI